MISPPDKPYSLDALADALVAADRWREACEPLRGYFVTRGEAFARAFGLVDDENGPSSRKRYLGYLLKSTLKKSNVEVSPFAGYLEVPRDIVEAAQRFGPAISAAQRELERALRAMLIGLLEELVTPGKAFVTQRELLEHGFDATAEAPDPDDYW